MLHSLYEPLLRSVKIKTAFVLVLIHIGALLTIFGLASLPPSIDIKIWNILVAGTALLYGGFLLTSFFILWPIYNLAKAIRKFLDWKNLLLHELPQLIATVPPLIQSIQAAFSIQAAPLSKKRAPLTKKQKARSKKQAISKAQAAA